MLKKTLASELLGVFRAGRPDPVSRRTLARLAALSPDRELHLRQPRFYDYNVWSERKVWEKLDYMHLNPVKRGLVSRPGDWPRSSDLFHARGDRSMLAVDPWPGSSGFAPIVKSRG